MIHTMTGPRQLVVYADSRHSVGGVPSATPRNECAVSRYAPSALAPDGTQLVTVRGAATVELWGVRDGGHGQPGPAEQC